MGAFPPNRFRVRVFSSDSQPSKGSAHGSVHENLHLLHEGNHVLSVQSSPIRSVRVHWTDNWWNRSNTTDFNSPGNMFSRWIIITQGYLHSFFTFVLDDGWIYSWERTCFLWLSRTILGSVSLISHDFGAGNNRVRFVGYPVWPTDRTVGRLMGFTHLASPESCISSFFCCLRMVSSTKFALWRPQLRWF